MDYVKMYTIYIKIGLDGKLICIKMVE